MRSYLIEECAQYLADKDRQPEGLVDNAGMTGPELAEVLIHLTGNSNKRVKNRAAKLLSHLSQVNAAAVENHREPIIAMFRERDNILRWNALTVLGNISGYLSIDECRGLLRVLDELLDGDSMVTAGHVIFALEKMALNHPGLQSEIIARMLAVESWPFKPECIGILTGKVLSALESLAPSLSMESDGFPAVREFAKRHLNSGKSSISHSARRIMKMCQRKSD